MEIHEARLGAAGTVLIPEAIRAHFKLKEGDRIDFYVDRNRRSVTLVARNGKISDIKGLFKHSGPPIDDDEEISKSVAEKQDRINREWAEWHEFQQWRKSRGTDAAE